jgi:hypothetical protein
VEGDGVKYLLLIYGDESGMDWTGVPAEQQAAELQAWNDYTDWLKGKGWHLGGDALESTASATTVRERDGKILTTDGPFAETKEQLGGYYFVQCENLDEAIEAASKIPSVAMGGSIEVRPVQEF